MKLAGDFRVHALLLVCAFAAASPTSAAKPSPPPGAHPKLLLQDEYSLLPLCETGVRNDAWMISGFGVRAHMNITIPAFLAATRETILASLGDYLARFPDLSTDTSDIVMLDIEHPVHPRFLGTLVDPDDPAYDPDLFLALVNGIKLRIAVVREVFPRARLALFATINPDPRGREQQPQFLVSFLGYLKAGGLGLYDQLDYLVPVLYLRFGPTDRAIGTIDDYTRLGIHKSRELTRTDGSSLPLFPLLSFLVFNLNSNHRLLPADPGALAEQVRILREEGVGRFAFWNGSDELDPAGPSILETFEALFDPRDVQGDGDVDVGDLLAIKGCFKGPNASCSTEDFLYGDLDCDGDVDPQDLEVFLQRPRGGRP